MSNIGFALVFVFLALVVAAAVFVVINDKIILKEQTEIMNKAKDKVNEMGFNISKDFDVKNQVAVLGEDYAFVLKYSTASFNYIADVYDRDGAVYLFTIHGKNLEQVLKGGSMIINTKKENVSNKE